MQQTTFLKENRLGKPDRLFSNRGDGKGIDGTWSSEAERERHAGNDHRWKSEARKGMLGLMERVGEWK
jgi:hypothetical protein